MPKKLYKDGPKADKDDITAVIAAWHGEAELLNTSIEKKHLVQDHKGDSVVKICLPNAARNYVLLMHVATNMLKRKRLSADPVDVLTLIFVGWYTKVQEAYKTCEAFDAKAWAFKDGWVVHKLLTLFRIKAIRGEVPRDFWMYLVIFPFNLRLRTLMFPKPMSMPRFEGFGNTPRIKWITVHYTISYIYIDMNI